MGHNTLKSSRLQGAVIVWFVCNLFFGLELLTADHWVDLTKWIFGIYASSEVGAKGAAALKDKVNNNA